MDKVIVRRQISIAILFWLTFPINAFAQNEFTSRKGSKFFPGHYDIVITVNNSELKYELFNHWYSWSYAKYRQMTIPLNSLARFNQQNDSVKFHLLKNKVILVDKKYRLNRKIKHKNLCASAETMRKIDFAYQLSRANNIGHLALYEREDLKLSQVEFEQKVGQNLKERLK
ncbi:hypothetical protein [Adhaeribacter radiodurans]|uniref:Uncharacterized protein n=1 Tax=Adhaeribacter radiodurans TaxID=2745197 RepID=A0A7L7L5B4_9BACT|nr:hypothetical protein [Adhaeribacter radiodurans]QMU27963.1 hypothetical protein HUW48_07845 [Adhaeribacter radiodurans]